MDPELIAPEPSQAPEPAPAPAPEPPVASAPPAPEGGENQSEQQEQPDEAGEQQERDENGQFVKKGARARIDELTAARHRAEREAAYWRGVAESASKKPAESPSAPPQPPAKPALENFKTYEEWVEAMIDWRADQKVAEAVKQSDLRHQQTAEQKAVQVRQETFQTRRDEFVKVAPDFAEVVGGSDAIIAPHVEEAILESEVGPALAYHLAKNPEVAARLSGLNPVTAAREIGRIEASLSKPSSAPAPAPSVKPTSKAPAPVNPVKATGQANINPATASMDDYVAWRTAQGAHWARPPAPTKR